MYRFGFSFLILFSLFSTSVAQTIVETGTSKTVRLSTSGRLVYHKDDRGNSLPDFSYVGYHSGEEPIPNITVKLTISPVDGDNTGHIQAAIDKLAEMPQGKDGFRGALLLKKGVYRIEGKLTIEGSGIVLRGEGDGTEGTTLVAAGYGDPKYKRSLITVGNGKRQLADQSSKQVISDTYVPVGSHAFTIESAKGYTVGERIVVHRPSTKEWIKSIGCDKLKSRWQEQDGKKVDQTRQWQPGEYDFYFERRITAIKGNEITIDAPIVHALDSKFGGGAIYKYQAPGRSTEIGIENLRLISEFSKPVPGNPFGDPKRTRSAEEHGWHAIKLNRNSENTWVRNVTGNYFGWSLVSASGVRATVQDCLNLGHASKIAGGRRYPFMIDGQLNLMQRCVAIEGRHEFVNQARTAGPNVFVDCIGKESKSSAGPHHRYAVGNLYDNIKSGRHMESRFRGNSGTGHGWAGTQTCFYNCIAPGFSVKAPPGGISWVIGSGKTKKDNILPQSLYYAQVKERLGANALRHLATEKQLNEVGSFNWTKERLRAESITK